jgi:hypothetical protein
LFDKVHFDTLTKMHLTSFSECEFFTRLCFTGSFFAGARRACNILCRVSKSSQKTSKPKNELIDIHFVICKKRMTVQTFIFVAYMREKRFFPMKVIVNFLAKPLCKLYKCYPTFFVAFKYFVEFYRASFIKS